MEKVEEDEKYFIQLKTPSKTHLEPVPGGFKDPPAAPTSSGILPALTQSGKLSKSINGRLHQPVATSISSKAIKELDTDSFVCYECRESFLDKISFTKHWLEHVKDGLEKRVLQSKPRILGYTCDVCKSQFSLKRNLQRHIMNVCFKDLYRGEDVCPISTIEKLATTYVKPTRFACSFCDRRFKSKWDLTEHLKTVHSSLRPFQCLSCEACFKTRKHLHNHDVKVHSSRSFKCPSCDAFFKSETAIKQHCIYKHSDIRPFNCSLCEDLFKTKGALKVHYGFKHSNYRPHKCLACDVAFATKCLLKQHCTFKHSDDRPFKCQLCDRCFKTKGDSKKHLSKHSSLRPHQCRLCNHLFKWKNDLTRHLARIHSIYQPSN